MAITASVTAPDGARSTRPPSGDGRASVSSAAAGVTAVRSLAPAHGRHARLTDGGVVGADAGTLLLGQAARQGVKPASFGVAGSEGRLASIVGRHSRGVGLVPAHAGDGADGCGNVDCSINGNIHGEISRQ